MKDRTEVKNQTLKTSVLGIGVVICVILILVLTMSKNVECSRNQSNKEYSEYETITSRLDNQGECYLCGSSNESMLDYYKKCDTIGIIGLNQWYILDLRLKEYDSKGNVIEKEGSSSTYGNTQGMDYYVNATPSRGMANATIKSTDGMLDDTMIRQHLCQQCLDKVTNTFVGNVEETQRALPFCVVDFKTLELYPVQRGERRCFVRDYWVQIEECNDEIEIEVFYLPKLYGDKEE
jgi:hypothetical protein